MVLLYDASLLLIYATARAVFAEGKRQLHERMLRDQKQHKTPFVSKPCLCLATHRVHPAEFRGASGCVLGLFLLDDAHVLCWTLNDRLMDAFSIGSYMEPVRQRKLFLSVMAMGGHQRNDWSLSEMELFVAS